MAEEINQDEAAQMTQRTLYLFDQYRALFLKTGECTQEHQAVCPQSLAHAKMILILALMAKIVGITDFQSPFYGMCEHHIRQSFEEIADLAVVLVEEDRSLKEKVLADATRN